jgi:hypothetical protein
MKYAPTLLLFLVGTSVALAQGPDSTKPSTSSPPSVTSTSPAPNITAKSTPVELARVAFAAHGGDKFKNLKSMWLSGSVNLYAPNNGQPIPGKFIMVSVGDRMRLDVSAPPAPAFKQIYDGQQTYSSFPGLELPPPSQFGLRLLAKFEEPGYTVSALPDKNKRRGFRIADSEGHTTDFYIDPASGRVMTYLIAYNGFTYGTEHSKLQELEGVLIPMSFSQRLETQMGTFFAEFKVKDVRLNQPVADDVFAIPQG